MSMICIYLNDGGVHAYRYEDETDRERCRKVFEREPERYKLIEEVTEWGAKALIGELEREIKRKVWNV